LKSDFCDILEKCIFLKLRYTQCQYKVTLLPSSLYRHGLKQQFMRTGFILLIVFQLNIAFSQVSFYEIGVFGGVSNYQGDLAPIAFVAKETHLAAGAFAKYNLTSIFGMKASVYTGLISGNDDNSTEYWKQQRNLSFQSRIYEASLMFEMNLAKYNPKYKYTILAPYVFFGAGFYHFNPRTRYEGIWYDLQPLGTEGQGLPQYPDRQPYNLTQYSFPMGFGFKGRVDKYWNIGVEMGYRKTITDYLDDVSTTYISKELLDEFHGEITWELSNRSDEVNGGIDVYKDDTKYRGDDTNKDWYIFSGVIISRSFEIKHWDEKKFKYKENAKKHGLRKSKRKMDCPGINERL